VQYRQYHNQPADSPLHKWLTEMWAAVWRETTGRFEVATFVQNDGIPGGDPQVLEMLVAGRVEFSTLMGGLLGAVVPVVEIQCVPFAFGNQAHVFAAMDGELGDYLRAELAVKGIYALPGASFEDGFRQITTRTKPIQNADDLTGSTRSNGTSASRTTCGRVSTCWQTSKPGMRSRATRTR
jgi:TRAP-type C4-dicarboxylate transport system substrate-binding protein